MIDLYKIEGTSNKEDEQLNGIEYNSQFYPKFQEDIEWLKKNIDRKRNE